MERGVQIERSGGMRHHSGGLLSRIWHRMNNTEHDIVAIGIIIAALIMFVGTGGNVLPKIVRAYAGYGGGPDRLLTNALLLNIALIIFGWRRYADLTREVAERRKAEQLAQQLALTDPLTGCLNRRSIIEAADALSAEASDNGQLTAMLMLDVDNFKAVNDVHGHQAGDMVLIALTSRVAAILPEGAALARLGGDEFACVIPFHSSRAESVDRLAGAILAEARQPIDIGPGTVDVTFSVGVVRSDQMRGGEAPDAAAMIHMADIAMYHAKKHGRNRFFWFEPTMETELRFRNQLESGIRRGVPQGEFVPYYEQQIDLETGELIGFEMLARWHSPEFGLVNPEVFIPVAEEIGVIAELSESLIRIALVDAGEWDPSLTLSVNISPVQLRDPWFPQKLLKLLVEANFPPERLDIEITESCLHENIGVVRSMVTSLKNQGIGISLDDFGTGYSSLAQLQSLPFDRIKIDRSFVTTLDSSKESSTIVQAIASLGEGMNMPITVEGIETLEVLVELRRMGKFKGQGYIYGFPEDAATIRERLAKLDRLVSVADPASELPLPRQQAIA